MFPVSGVEFSGSQGGAPGQYEDHGPPAYGHHNMLQGLADVTICPDVAARI